LVVPHSSLQNRHLDAYLAQPQQNSSNAVTQVDPCLRHMSLNLQSPVRVSLVNLRSQHSVRSCVLIGAANRRLAAAQLVVPPSSAYHPFIPCFRNSTTHNLPPKPSTECFVPSPLEPLFFMPLESCFYPHVLYLTVKLTSLAFLVAWHLTVFRWSHSISAWPVYDHLKAEDVSFCTCMHFFTRQYWTTYSAHPTLALVSDCCIISNLDLFTFHQYVLSLLTLQHLVLSPRLTLQEWQLNRSYFAFVWSTQTNTAHVLPTPIRFPACGECEKPGTRFLMPFLQSFTGNRVSLQPSRCHLRRRDVFMRYQIQRHPKLWWSCRWTPRFLVQDGLHYQGSRSPHLRV